MQRHTRRGSYFYVIDAFIASIIILATLIVVFSRFLSQQSSTQAFYTAEDFLATMEHTPVVTIDNPAIATWIGNGNITDPEISVIEQLVYFSITDTVPNPDTDNAQQLARIIAASAPAKVGLNITINGVSVYDQQRSASPASEANMMLSAKRIVVLKSSAEQIYPPYIVEVRTWQ